MEGGRERTERQKGRQTDSKTGIHKTYMPKSKYVNNTRGERRRERERERERERKRESPRPGSWWRGKRRGRRVRGL
jgi:hypothetical protein